MTKKEIEMIHAVINSLENELSGENRELMPDVMIADCEARIDVLTWLLQETGNL